MLSSDSRPRGYSEKQNRPRPCLFGTRVVCHVGNNNEVEQGAQGSRVMLLGAVPHVVRLAQCWGLGGWGAGSRLTTSSPAVDLDQVNAVFSSWPCDCC